MRHEEESEENIIVYTPKRLPQDQWVSAAENAVAINPVNRPRLEALTAIIPDFKLTRERISVATTKFWHTKGVRLTVGSLGQPSRRVAGKDHFAHECLGSGPPTLSSWKAVPTRRFGSRGLRETATGPTSGVDILSIDADQPTMNLESFAMSTPESEFRRVVRHETGHTLDCPDEHMRREIVDGIDVQKAIEFFGATQGWSPEEVRQQVLTPLEESSLMATDHTDPNSIMCYQLPGAIMKDRKPVPGGLDIDPQDFEFMGKIYPK